MNLSEKIEEIKVYGSLGYSPDQIADALGLSISERVDLKLRLNIFNDELAVAYRKGFVTAEAKIDIALAKQAQTGDEKAIETQSERSRQRKIRDLKEKLFGI